MIDPRSSNIVGDCVRIVKRADPHNTLGRGIVRAVDWNNGAFTLLIEAVGIIDSSYGGSPHARDGELFQVSLFDETLAAMADNESGETQGSDDPLVDLLSQALGACTGKLRLADAYRICQIEPGKASQEQIIRFGRAIRELGWERQRVRFDGSLQYAYVKGTSTEREVELVVLYDSLGRAALAASDPKEEPEIPKSVTEYLDALVWDGVPRIDRWLIEYGGAEDSAYVRSVSRLMLVAAVRRARLPGCVFGQLPILEGPQSVGKSSALRILAVNDAWYTDESLGSDTRRFMESTVGKWIVEVSELESMEDLKAVLSRQWDAARMAYQHKQTRVPRQFVLIGTTNATEGYLRDATGNRRFWPVRVQRFNLERLRADRDQLWAEAAKVEMLGVSLHLEAVL